jgi:hypothetical protein
MIGRLIGAAVVLLLPVAAAAHGEHGAAKPLGSDEIDVRGTLARRAVWSVR